MFDQLVRYLFDDAGNPKGIPQAGDLVYSFAPLASSTHRLRCDGTAYSTTTYEILYLAIGDVYKNMPGVDGIAVGDPAPGFFRVPNCGARFALATGSLPVGGAVVNGGSGGEEQHVLTIPELPVHHVTTTFHRSSYDTGPDELFATGNDNPDATHGDYPDLNVDSQDVGGDDPHNNMPPYYGVHTYIVTGI